MHTNYIILVRIHKFLDDLYKDMQVYIWVKNDCKTFVNTYVLNNLDDTMCSSFLIHVSMLSTDIQIICIYVMLSGQI